MHARPVTLATLAVLLHAGACDCGGEPIVATQPRAQAPALLDFGPIGEGTTVTRPVVIENVGQAELELTGVIGAGSSPELTLETPSLRIAPRESGEVNVRFAPIGVGEDNGSVVFATNDPRAPELTVALHGGPIEPTLSAPELVDFAPADASIVSRLVVLQNDGLATLHLDSIAVDVGANPQFQTDAPFDVDVLPAGQLQFQVTHARALRTDEGRLLIRSSDPADAPQGGVRAVRLLPDPLGPCEDGLDNDGDDLSDFPDDPGCSDYFDDTEENQVECVDTATRICGTDLGVCEPGLQTCAGGAYGPCEGETSGNPTEAQCDGADDDCDGRTDEEITEACVINGCAGLRACVEGDAGVFGPCIPNVSSAEVCNTLDDNCDGTPDNLPPQSCVGPGSCAGSQLCDAATGSYGSCFCNGVCGDGAVDLNEQCDDGDTQSGDGCSGACRDEFCGDGLRQIGLGEQCDDGNTVPGDGCENDCTVSVAACDATGRYTLATPISYACCFFINQNITQWVIAPSDTATTGSPAGVGMIGNAAMCPSGTFSQSFTEAGGCTETYSIDGTFTGADTFSGTYTLEFIGQDCDCSGLDTPCVTTTFPFTATR